MGFEDRMKDLETQFKSAEMAEDEARERAKQAKMMGNILGSDRSANVAEIMLGQKPKSKEDVRRAFSDPAEMDLEGASNKRKRLLEKYSMLQKEKERSEDLDYRQQVLGLKQENMTKEDQYRQALLNYKQKEGLLKGKQLNATNVLKINEGNAIPTTLDQIEKTIDKKKNLFGVVTGRLGSLNPYNVEAQVTDAEMRAASQQFGRFMEGGVLRKEDEEKYRKMFPQLSDNIGVAKGKLKVVRDMLSRKQESDVKALKDQGFDLAGLDQIKPRNNMSSMDTGLASKQPDKKVRSDNFINDIGNVVVPRGEASDLNSLSDEELDKILGL